MIQSEKIKPYYITRNYFHSEIFLFLGVGLGEMWCTGKSKKLFSFDRKSFSQEIRVLYITLFIYFALGFGKFTRLIKSAVISGFERFFYFALDQQSSHGIRIFFILHFDNIHAGV